MTRPMNDRTPTEAADLSPELLVQRAREMADIAIRERKLGEYTAPYAGALLRAMADLLASPPAPAAEPVAFAYRNWRGEVSERHVRIIGIRFGSSEWHPEPQLLLRAFDLDKGEAREFAVNDIGPHPLDAAAIRAEARREALEEAAAWHDANAEIARADAERFRGGSNPYTQRMMIVARHQEAARAIRAFQEKGTCDAG